ncbi:MAG: penicillin-binding protein 2 [Pseudomonadales bacterium]
MNDHKTLKDPYKERVTFLRRVLLMVCVIVLAFGVLFYRYYDLQINQHDHFRTQSDRNRVHARSVAPVRGFIFDRNGVLLAENRPSYQLALVRERIVDREVLIARLQQLLTIDPIDLKRFERRRQSRHPYEPIPLKFQLSDEDIAILAVNRHTLPGVEITAMPERHYPQGAPFAHVLGYVGRISERDQAELDPVNYAATDHIGKSGIERFYEGSLHGTVGFEHVETNARGRVLRVLEQGEAERGSDLILHLDVGVQLAAYKALEGKRGSIVAIDVQTGGVLAMVSAPAFDPNLFVGGISSKDYRELNESADLPLFNRSLMGQYPPGSTIKPMLALAGLDYGIVTEETKIRDPGWYSLPKDTRRYRDWKKGGHGKPVDLNKSVVQSCDVYYYDLAFHMGIDRIHEFLSKFGIGEKSGIDMPIERKGLLPSKAWKRGAYNLPWYPGETLSVGIGQGYMLATPLQLAVATATLANRGTRPVPRLLKSISGELPDDPLGRHFNVKDPATWDAIHQAMIDVVHTRRGTAWTSAGRHLKDYRMAGKTGTAQVVGIAQGEEYDAEKLSERNRDHGLFIGFAPAESPRIAVAAVIENGEHGSWVAPVVKQVIDAWYASEQAQNPIGELASGR